MELTEEQIRRIAKRTARAEAQSATAQVANIIGGGPVAQSTEAQHAKEADHAAAADTATTAETAKEADHAKKAAALDDDALENLDNKYLRKDKDDATEHKLGVGALDINGGDLTIKEGTSSFGITKEGVAKLAGAVVDYLKSSDFTKGTGVGFDGTGYGITRDAAGKYTLEIDNLVARMKMIVAELEVHEMTFIGGTVVMSSCGNRVDRVEALDADGNSIATADSNNPTLTIPSDKTADKFRCYFLASDGDRQIKNEWTVGQLARAKTNNIAAPGNYTNYQNRDYWRLVVGVSQEPVTIEGKDYHYIDLSNSTSKEIYLTDAGGAKHLVTLGGVSETLNSLPFAGDNIIGLGHCWEEERKNAAILSVDRIGWTLYKGIDGYDLPKENIVNKFGIDETIVTTDHFIFRPYAAPSETQTVAVVRGAYNDAASYGHNDMVTLDGQTWIGSGIPIGKTITGQKPSATSPYWSLAAAKGIQGEKGDGYSISFLLNDVPVDVINFDTVKGMEGTDVSLEADFFNNSVAVNVNKAVITCYDAEGNVLGSPIEATNAENVVVDGGNLYLSKNCKLITAVAYDAAGNVIKEKSVTVIRDTVTYGLTKMSDTSATVLSSGTTTNATFHLHYNLHYKAVKMVGTVAHEATIASIKTTIDGTEKVQSVNGLEGTLSGDGTKSYDASNRPVNSLPVTVTLADGTVLYDSVPVTMEAGVAIDINNSIGKMSVTVQEQGGYISTLQSDGKSISEKVSGIDSGLEATGIDIENHKIAATTNNFVVRNNSGTTTFSIDKDGNIVGAGNAYFKGTITGSVISGSTIKSKDGTYETTIQGGSITTNSIAATGGSIGAWTIKDGGLTTVYGSKACIEMRDSKSSFRLDSDNTTNGGSLLDIYNSSGRVISIVSEDSDEAALYIRSNASNRNLAISTFGNNSFLARVGEATTINRFAYACVRTGDVNVDFDDLFVSKETSGNKYPGNVVITSNYNYEQTVKFPANPALGVQLIVIQGTNKKVHFDGNGHRFQQGTDVSSSANSNQNGQWNLFIFDGQYWQCIYITGHLLW